MSLSDFSAWREKLELAEKRKKEETKELQVTAFFIMCLLVCVELPIVFFFFFFFFTANCFLFELTLIKYNFDYFQR